MTFKQRQHHLVSIVNIIWCQLYSQEVVAVESSNLSTFQVITIIRTVTNFNRTLGEANLIVWFTKYLGLKKYSRSVGNNKIIML